MSVCHDMLPAILDPVLAYLAEILPSPLYSFIINVLSHCLALISAFTGLLASLMSKHPLTWDAQTVLPPLISLLAAYLALASLYRTTTWMIRMSFWFMKWGVILGALVAGVGWYIGITQTQVNGLTNNNLISYVGNMALDMINGPNRNAAGGARSARSARTHSPRSHSRSTKRPKAWESFNRHREWQYSEDRSAGDETSDVENMINKVIDVAGQAFRDNSWWTGWTSVMGDIGGQSGQNAEEKSDQTRVKASGKSRSR